MSSRLAISLACVPDVAGLRRLHRLPNTLSDDEVAEFAWQRCRASREGDSLPPQQQRVVQVSGVMRSGEGLQWVSLAGGEASILQDLQTLFSQVESRVMWSPVCVSMSAVLACRAMIWQLELPLHLEMQDLAEAHGVTGAPLHEMAVLSRLPMRQELDEGELWRAYSSGDSALIEALNMTRAITLHLLDLRYRRQRGELDALRFLQELVLVRQSLQVSKSAHFQTYLADWATADKD